MDSYKFKASICMEFTYQELDVPMVAHYDEDWDEDGPRVRVDHIKVDPDLDVINLRVIGASTANIMNSVKNFDHLEMQIENYLEQQQRSNRDEVVIQNSGIEDRI